MIRGWNKWIEKQFKILFLEYKEKLINLVNKINDGNDVLDEYYKTLNNLLSYDLGRIFPNKWQGLTIVSDENHIADFSKTNAIINFNYMDINGYADFRNCKIINLKSIEGKTFGMTFDRQVYLDNSDIFLSNRFSKSIKDKYDGALLTFDDNPNACGFELLDDCKDSKERNKYDKSNRKYERFNENINDIFTIEAEEYLRKKEIYLIEEKKYVNNDWNNLNTGLVTKNILRPLLERYRSVVIDAKINGDRNILSSYIGDYNFEELIDIVNKVDYLWKRGLDYKLNNDKDNEDVIEYYKQLERVKEIYKNIDAFVAANNEIKSVKK